MSSRTIARSSSNMNSASARASSVLPTPVGPRKTKLPIGRFGSCRPGRAGRGALGTGSPGPPRPVRVLQAGAGAAERVGDGLDRLLLADDALVEPLFHVHELLGLALEQLV